MIFVSGARALNSAPHSAGVDVKLAQIEEALMQVNMNGSEANLAFPGMLNEQLASFASTLEDADTLPTTQQNALYHALHGKLQVQLALWESHK